MSNELTVGPWDVSRSEYHADRTCVSSSSLKDLAFEVPYYHGRHVDGLIPSPDSTEDMDVGTVTHTAWLEPWKLADEVAVLPEGLDRRTKAGKSQWEAFCETSAGKLVVSAKNMELVLAMVSALNARPELRAIKSLPGECEHIIRWQDGETGVWCRAMLDKWIVEMPHGRRPLVFDLKTTAHAVGSWAFGKVCEDMAYHRQAAHYVSGVKHVYGVDCDFMFAVVSKDARWHSVACHTLKQSAMELGRVEVADMLREIAERRKTGDWSSRHEGNIYETDLPAYAYKRS